MGVDIQRVTVTKRLAAFLLDAILLFTIAVSICTGLFGLVGYNGYLQTVEDAYARYGAQYGVTLPVDLDVYENAPAEERESYDLAYAALNQDAEAVRAKKMSDELPLLVITGSLLIAHLILEFIVPLLFKNGQTLGKKMLSIALIRKDGVKMSNVQLFVRSFLGKFTIGTMLPTYLILLIAGGRIGILGTVLVGILVLTQVILLLGREHALIQDRMAGTLAVDMATQQIFDSEEELIEYTKRRHAELAERQDY